MHLGLSVTSYVCLIMYSTSIRYTRIDNDIDHHFVHRILFKLLVRNLFSLLIYWYTIPNRTVLKSTNVAFLTKCPVQNCHYLIFGVP